MPLVMKLLAIFLRCSGNSCNHTLFPLWKDVRVRKSSSLRVFVQQDSEASQVAEQLRELLFPQCLCPFLLDLLDYLASYTVDLPTAFRSSN